MKHRVGGVGGIANIAGITGILFSAIVVASFLTSVPGKSFSFARPESATSQHAMRDPLSGWNVALFRDDAGREEPSGPGLPVRLKIGGISVDAAIEYVGITAGGAMDVPKDPLDVGWLELGTRPGAIGSAVIAGHYGRKDGKPSVFDDLYKLRAGDRVMIEDEAGTIYRFVVRESRRYDPKADATAVFTAPDGKPHLNLITCEGSWNTGIGGYPRRLVVFTDLEGQ